MEYGEKLAALIDEKFAEASDEDGLRTHLGASILGKDCIRELWLNFRWAATEQVPGRMLRLFARGHKEEDTFVKLLQSIGCTVWTHGHDGKQFRISYYGGHVGGSCDGVAQGLPWLPPDLPVLLEMKTHKKELFAQLQKKGLKDAHPKHWKQAQIYMHGLNLKWCLYCAVNKNDDTLWFHMFEAEPDFATSLVKRGGEVVFTPEIPNRINNNPSWFGCKFCAQHGVCFHTKMPYVNCRTCRFSKPEQNGSWSCAAGQPEITTQPKVGCPSHQFDPQLFHKVAFLRYTAEGFTVFRGKNGLEVTNGLGHTPSTQLDLYE